MRPGILPWQARGLQPQPPSDHTEVEIDFDAVKSYPDFMRRPVLGTSNRPAQIAGISRAHSIYQNEN
jgi:hypothetical protein